MLIYYLKQYIQSTTVVFTLRGSPWSPIVKPGNILWKCWGWPADWGRRPGLSTNSIFQVDLCLQNTIDLPGGQTLIRENIVSLFKGFLSWHGALHGPHRIELSYWAYLAVDHRGSWRPRVSEDLSEGLAGLVEGPYSDHPRGLELTPSSSSRVGAAKGGRWPGCWPVRQSLCSFLHLWIIKIYWFLGWSSK